MKLLIVVCIALMIEAVCSTDCVCGSCGVITSETDTTIYSHLGYDSQSYPNDHTCSDQIDPLNADKCAQVEVVNFSLRSWYNQDYLYFVDNYPSGDVTRGFFRDQAFKQLPAPVYGKPGVPLTLRFESDLSEAHDGYELTVRVGECPLPGPPTCECGACDTLTSGVTEITSPNFPFNYEDHTNCTINIVAPEDLDVQLTITFFWVENGWDKLYLIDNGVTQYTLTGILPAGTVYNISAGSNISLNFRSDFVITTLGFSFLVEFPTVPACPDPSWYLYEGQCYKMLTNYIRFNEAMNACPALNSHSYLVQIETRDELDFIREIIENDQAAGGPEKYWTSGHMVPQIVGNNNGTWYWGDGSPIQGLFWGPHEPNFLRGKEFCLNLLYKRDFEENDSPCRKRHAYICEMPANV